MTIPWAPLVGAAVVMAVVAMLMRRGTVSEPVGTGATRRETGHDALEEAADAASDDADEDDDEAPGPDEMLFVTSNGEVLLPGSVGVRMLPLGEAHTAVLGGMVPWEQLRAEVLSVKRRAEGGGLPGYGLDAGDFSAGRVVRGAPDVDPWRLELLGRDGEYRPLAFETEESARGALALLERRGVIQRPHDDDGSPIPVPAEQFEAARHAFEDTLEELANMPDVSDIEDPRR